MLSEWLAYKIGRNVEENSTRKNPYPNGKPLIDFVIEGIAIVFVVIVMIVMYFGS